MFHLSSPPAHYPPRRPGPAAPCSFHLKQEHRIPVISPGRESYGYRGVMRACQGTVKISATREPIGHASALRAEGRHCARIPSRRSLIARQQTRVILRASGILSGKDFPRQTVWPAPGPLDVPGPRPARARPARRARPVPGPLDVHNTRLLVQPAKPVTIQYL